MSLREHSSSSNRSAISDALRSLLSSGMSIPRSLQLREWTICMCLALPAIFYPASKGMTLQSSWYDLGWPYAHFALSISRPSRISIQILDLDAATLMTMSWVLFMWGTRRFSQSAASQTDWFAVIVRGALIATYATFLIRLLPGYCHVLKSLKACPDIWLFSHPVFRSEAICLVILCSIVVVAAIGLLLAKRHRYSGRVRNLPICFSALILAISVYQFVGIVRSSSAFFVAQ